MASPINPPYHRHTNLLFYVTVGDDDDDDHDRVALANIVVVVVEATTETRGEWGMKLLFHLLNCE